MLSCQFLRLWSCSAGVRISSHTVFMIFFIWARMDGRCVSDVGSKWWCVSCVMDFSRFSLTAFARAGLFLTMRRFGFGVGVSVCRGSLGIPRLGKAGIERRYSRRTRGLWSVRPMRSYVVST